MEDDDLEFTILNKREVRIFQIPPASSSSGHKADDWKSPIWTGRCRVVGQGKNCFIKMIDPSSGKLFAQCTIPNGEHSAYVERVTDSSRYFVLKITNGGRHAFVGLGFEDRNDAFDFYCALGDFKTQFVDRDREQEAPISSEPAKDYSLKEGQKISFKINGVGGKKSTATSQSGAGYNGGSAGGFQIAPPPSAGGIAPPPAAGGASRRVAPAAAASPASAPNAAAPATAAGADFFGDFDDFQSAPATQDLSDPFFSGDAFSQLSLGSASAAPTPAQALAGAPFGMPVAAAAPTPAQAPATAQFSMPMATSPTTAFGSTSSPAPMAAPVWGAPAASAAAQQRPQQQPQKAGGGGGYDPFLGLGDFEFGGTSSNNGFGSGAGFGGLGGPAPPKAHKHTAEASSPAKAAPSGPAKKADPFASFDPFAM